MKRGGGVGAFGEGGEHDEAEDGLPEAVEKGHRREGAGLSSGGGAAEAGSAEWILDHGLVFVGVIVRERIYECEEAHAYMVFNND